MGLLGGYSICRTWLGGALSVLPLPKHLRYRKIHNPYPFRPSAPQRGAVGLNPVFKFIPPVEETYENNKKKRAFAQQWWGGPCAKVSKTWPRAREEKSKG